MSDEKRKEAIKELDSMVHDSDVEVEHGIADDILVEFLRDAGFADVADAYERARARVGFWYA